MKTVEEQEAEKRRLDVEKAAREEEARGIAKGSVEYFNMASTADEQSRTLFTTAENMISLIKAQPGAFELLSKPGIANAVKRAAEEGIKSGILGTISIPFSTIEEYRLNDAQKDALNLYTNQLAIALNANRKMTRIPGEGEISNLETNLSNSMLSVKNASPRVLQFINEYTMMSSNYAQMRFKILNDLRASGMPIADARMSQEMRNLNDGYVIALRSLAQRNAELLKTAEKSSKSAPKTQQKPPSENSRRLDEALRN
jgi:arginine repressor